jgi:imidazolonepropionase
MIPSSKFKNIGQLTTYNSDGNGLITLSDTEVLVKDGQISAIGSSVGDANVEIDCGHALVTPGFVDPHTHPVFLHGRENEFEMRIKGASYQEISEAGGGIRSSIEGVRSAAKNTLYKKVMVRMDRFLRLGTTTIEAKSGYGLDVDSELKSLEIIDKVNKNHPIDIMPTFLGAHDFPPEFADNRQGYIDEICQTMIPAVSKQGIAIFCDVFCEKGYFSPEESERILKTAISHKLIPRIHADEFQDSAAAPLAAKVGAISADHLMAISKAGIEALSKAGVIATLLPGTTYFLGSDTWAPARELINNGITVALATDFNPGSCHIQSMPFIISLACNYLKMNLEEAFIGATYSAAESLDCADRIGSLEVGKQADIVIWGIDTLTEIPYNVTDIPIQKVIKSGSIVYDYNNAAGSTQMGFE